MTESPGIQNQKFSLFNVPNILTFSRIILIPFFVMMMVQKKALGALIIILAAGVTDVLDGFTARIWHQRTRLGTLFDPAADKLLITCCFILLSLPKLSLPNCIPLWLTVIVIGRDVFIALGSLVVFLAKRVSEIGPTLLGKISTICQILTVWAVVYLNYRQKSPAALNWLYYITLVATCFSGFQYFLKGLRIFGSKKA
jgi:cardiolipin synthase